MTLVADTRALLAAQLPDWEEARLNVEEVTKFPAWRVDYGGAEQRGAGWRTLVEVEVLAGYALAEGNEEAIEGYVLAAIIALRNWGGAQVTTVSGSQEIVMPNGAFYGVTITITGTGPA